MANPWLTAAWCGFFGASALLAVIHAAAGLRVTGRRYRLAWTEPDRLCSAAPPPPQALSAALAVVGLVGGLLLVTPVTGEWHSPLVAGSGLAAGAYLAGGALLRSLPGRWSVATAAAGAAFITIGTCSLGRAALGAAEWNGLILGCAATAAVWTWLSRVWLQQLDAGRAWTAAGRIIPLTRHFAAGAGLLGVFASIWILPSSSPDRGRFSSVAVIAVLLSTLVLALRRWWKVEFVILLVLGFSCMLTLIAFQLMG